MSNEKQFYDSLKLNLENNHNFPEDYLYKFIIPNDEKLLGELYVVFDGTKNSITTRESSNKKYISCSIQCFVLDANQVIDIYKKAAKIEGIVML